MALPLDDIPSPGRAWFLRPDGRDASESIHGVGHTRRVTALALTLSDRLGVEPWQREAVLRAALWHDIGRTHDGGDHLHGGKSAGKAIGLGLHRGLEGRVVEAALHAVSFHCTEDRYGEESAARLDDPGAGLLVFQVLKDADALDRVRFGPGRLDLRQLRLGPSRALVGDAWGLLEVLPG